MMKIGSVMSALSALGLLTVSGVAAASSHREAPSIAADPAADNTDTLRLGPGQQPGGRGQLHRPGAARGRAQLGVVLARRAVRDPHRARRDEPGGRAHVPDPASPHAAPTSGNPNAEPAHAPLRPAASSSSPSSPAAARSARPTRVTQLTNGGSPTVIATNVPVPPPNVGPETNTVAYADPRRQDLREASSSTRARTSAPSRAAARSSLARATIPSGSTWAPSSTSPSSAPWPTRPRRRATASRT